MGIATDQLVRPTQSPLPVADWSHGYLDRDFVIRADDNLKVMVSPGFVSQVSWQLRVWSSGLMPVVLVWVGLGGGGSGAGEGAGGGADVHVEGDADVGVAGEAGGVGGVEVPGEQGGDAEDVAEAVPGSGFGGGAAPAGG